MPLGVETHTDAHTCTHALTHTDTHTQTHTHTHPSCPVFPLPSAGHMAFQKEKGQKQQEQTIPLLGNIWFYDSSHGTATKNPEE